MNKHMVNIIGLFSLVLITLGGCKLNPGPVIIFPEGSSQLEVLAAKELRRYIYLRTGELLPVLETNNIPSGDVILITNDNNPILIGLSELKAPEGGFFIKSGKGKTKNLLIISGNDSESTLYGAYHFAEKLACRFYLHGDVIPDEKITLDIHSWDEKGQPVSLNGRQWATRGIQPFQNFPPGAVMWGKENWKMHMSQLPKMGMNFIGLHTYMHDPEDDHVGDYGPNLNIWLGHENDLNPDGTVNYAFDATFFHTHQGIIGWGKTNTGELAGGASMLFPTDGYPSEIIGKTYHQNQPGYSQSFNNAGKLFSEVFGYAGKLGIKTATGIELPLGRDAETGGEEMVNGIPDAVQSRLSEHYGMDPISEEAAMELYKGMYKWLIYNEIPLDYFWMWTTEIWMPWGGASRDQVRVEAVKQSIRNAVQVYENMPEKPFSQFALGGWIFGAQGDPAVFEDVLPDLNAAYSFMNPPYNDEGEHMKTEDWLHQVPEARIKWPFTWMEYDYALEQPSFHMYRVLEDGLNAFEQNADGFIAEFWRTKMIAPMFAAYKDLTWDYAATGEEIQHDIPKDHKSRHKKIDEIHMDWASHEFGQGPAAKYLATNFAAFEKREEKRFMNVTNFIEGADDIYSQGYIKGDDWGSDHIWGPWTEEESKLDWIGEWENLRSTVKGAGNLARFDYWLNVLKAYKLMAEFASELNQYESLTNSGDLKAAAIIRSRLARLWEQMMSTQVQRVNDEIDLGVILNLDWRSWRNWVEGLYDENFMKAGGILPADKDPSQEYSGDSFITCMPLKSHVSPGEELRIKSLIMGEVDHPKIHYRKMGKGEFTSLAMKHEARGVYLASIPAQQEDFEWYVTAGTSLGDVVFPATADAGKGELLYQTVIVSSLSGSASKRIE